MDIHADEIGHQPCVSIDILPKELIIAICQYFEFDLTHPSNLSAIRNLGCVSKKMAFLKDYKYMYHISNNKYSDTFCVVDYYGKLLLTYYGYDGEFSGYVESNKLIQGIRSTKSDICIMRGSTFAHGYGYFHVDRSCVSIKYEKSYELFKDICSMIPSIEVDMHKLTSTNITLIIRKIFQKISPDLIGTLIKKYT